MKNAAHPNWREKLYLVPLIYWQHWSTELWVWPFSCVSLNCGVDWLFLAYFLLISYQQCLLGMISIEDFLMHCGLCLCQLDIQGNKNVEVLNFSEMYCWLLLNFLDLLNLPNLLDILNLSDLLTIPDPTELQDLPNLINFLDLLFLLDLMNLPDLLNPHNLLNLPDLLALLKLPDLPEPPNFLVFLNLYNFLNLLELLSNLTDLLNLPDFTDHPILYQTFYGVLTTVTVR